MIKRCLTVSHSKIVIDPFLFFVSEPPCYGILARLFFHAISPRGSADFLPFSRKSLFFVCIWRCVAFLFPTFFGFSFHICYRLVEPLFPTPEFLFPKKTKSAELRSYSQFLLSCVLFFWFCAPIRCFPRTLTKVLGSDGQPPKDSQCRVHRPFSFPFFPIGTNYSIRFFGRRFFLISSD